MQPDRGPSACSIVLLALIFGLIGGGVGGYYAARHLGPAPGPPTVVKTVPVTATSVSAGTVKVSTETDAIVQAVRSIGPAVVKITARREPKNYAELLMFRGEMISGIGSGVVFEYENEKFVLTNTHVIGGYTDLTVKLADGREFKGRPRGRMEAEDLAVLELINPPADLVAAPLGDSDSLEPGEWVIAVGNPFNFEHTVTVGVVSAVGLRGVGQEQRKVIQTDAAINSGNSGGPLVDLGGNVVGINFAIYNPENKRVATTVGIGFAIPVNQAKEMMYFLVNRGPWIGLLGRFLMPNSPGLSQYFGIGTDQGVVITMAYGPSPATEAGLRRLDAILSVDGEPVVTPDDVQKQVLKHKIGDAISFLIQRGSEQIEIEVIAGTVPEGA